jgi:hypothetical protein
LVQVLEPPQQTPVTQRPTCQLLSHSPSPYPPHTHPHKSCRTICDSDTMVHCCQVNNGTQARQSRTPPADPSWTGAPTLCCTSPRSHPFPPYPPFRGGALQSQCSMSPSRPHHPSRGGASPDQTGPSSCTKASSPNQQRWHPSRGGAEGSSPSASRRRRAGT